MLPPPTLDKRHALQLTGMLQALLEQMHLPESTALRVEARLGLLVDRERTEREHRRLTSRLHQATLRQAACVEDLDSRQPPGLDPSVLTRLAPCPWGRDRHTVLITGPTGLGKPWRACALGQKACREGWSVLSLRFPRLFPERPSATGDGRYVQLLTA